jgi:hypothetical protein
MIETARKIFFIYFFLAKDFEKDYDNDFRIIIGKFFSSLFFDLQVKLGWSIFQPVREKMFSSE